MGHTEMFADAPQGTRTDIMRATYAALTKHGYADLTIQRIADEFDKSKSLLYHHYDGKDALLVDFVGFLIDQFEAEMEATDDAAPPRRLDEFFDRLLPVAAPEERCEFDRVYVELRAAAAHDPTFRAKFTETDHALRDRLADVLRAGMESGDFREGDPVRIAEFLLATTLGTLVGGATSDDGWQANIRAELDAHVSARLELDGDGRRSATE
ncbi:TetR/AcrR family transcriptional regulator [Salinigranum salinum]|uniref:TetR/AcrR family transcriptional regulator n=1 Tax=Salinigranum salinum TaxID=1364937 RepID=UPI001260CDDD|nr:TetR/AcrR family transcriptional regulator [Salinigranum salinum]